VLLKTGDNISTDDIMPAGSKVLPLRSNIPEISKFVFTAIDKDFWMRAQEKGRGIVIGGNNYGQGSSREHAALAPMYLGVKAVLVKSFARIHKANLVNYGILPLVFESESDYDTIEADDVLDFQNIYQALEKPGEEKVRLSIKNNTKNKIYSVIIDVDERSRRVLRAGGLMPYAKAGGV